MVCPTLISVSLAPVSYFFWASADVANVVPSAKTSAAVDLNRAILSSRDAVAVLRRTVIGEPIPNESAMKRPLRPFLWRRPDGNKKLPGGALAAPQHEVAKWHLNCLHLPESAHLSPALRKVSGSRWRRALPNTAPKSS